MKWFRLQQPQLWGDYGSVLMGGYHRREDGGSIQLNRAGPLLPPVSFSWNSVDGERIVVSNDFRD